MKRTLIVLVVSIVFSSIGLGDDLKKLVESAISEEIKAFDEVEERWKKKKLKPGESLFLFGKKSLKPSEQADRMKELRIKVEGGEVSFRSISLRFAEIKPGQFGCPDPKANVFKCEQVIDGTEDFLGSYSINTVEVVRGKVIVPKTVDSRLLLFRGIPGGNQIIDRQRITVACPVIITERYTYPTSDGGTETTWVVESLANAVKRVSTKK